MIPIEFIFTNIANEQQKADVFYKLFDKCINEFNPEKKLSDDFLKDFNSLLNCDVPHDALLREFRAKYIPTDIDSKQDLGKVSMFMKYLIGLGESQCKTNEDARDNKYFKFAHKLAMAERKFSYAVFRANRKISEFKFFQMYIDAQDGLRDQLVKSADRSMNYARHLVEIKKELENHISNFNDKSTEFFLEEMRIVEDSDDDRLIAKFIYHLQGAKAADRNNKKIDSLLEAILKETKSQIIKDQVALIKAGKVAKIPAIYFEAIM